MSNLIVKIFPAMALVLSVFACIRPNELASLGFLIVPLLGLIMLGMGTTLSPADFAAAVKRPRAVLIGLVLQFLLMPLFHDVAAGIGGAIVMHVALKSLGGKRREVTNAEVCMAALFVVYFLCRVC